MSLKVTRTITVTENQTLSEVLKRIVQEVEEEAERLGQAGYWVHPHSLRVSASGVVSGIQYLDIEMSGDR